MAKKKASMPRVTTPMLRVIWAAMDWREAEEVLEEGFKGATCSGPERYWMSQRLKSKKDELMDACRALGKAEPTLFGRVKLVSSSTRSEK